MKLAGDEVFDLPARRGIYVGKAVDSRVGDSSAVVLPYHESEGEDEFLVVVELEQEVGGRGRFDILDQSRLE